MAERLTPDYEAAIRLRELLATRGPWGLYDDGTGRIDIAADLAETGHGYRCRRGIAQLDTEPIDNDPSHREWTESEDNEQVRIDAEFTAHARDDIPALLAEIDRLRAELLRAEAEAHQFRTALQGAARLAAAPSPAAGDKQPETEAVLAAKADQFDHLHSTTLPQLRREIEWHQDGKKRWRERAEKAEARLAELEQAAIEGRSALGALCYDLEDPGSNAFGALHMLSQATFATTTPRDDALAALARRDADKLDAAAESIVAACPDHGDEDEAWMDCHCVAAEELNRQASDLRKGGA